LVAAIQARMSRAEAANKWQVECDLALQITALDTQGGGEFDSKARLSSLLGMVRRQGVVPSRRSLECLCWRSVFEESADPVGVLPYVYEYISEYRQRSDAFINPFWRYLDHALAHAEAQDRERLPTEDARTRAAEKRRAGRDAILEKMRALEPKRSVREAQSVGARGLKFEEEIGHFLREKRAALREKIQAESERASHLVKQRGQIPAAGALQNGAESPGQGQEQEQQEEHSERNRRKHKGEGNGVDFNDPAGALPFAKDVVMVPFEALVRHALEHPEYAVPKIVPKSMRRKAEEAARIVKRLRTE